MKTERLSLLADFYEFTMGNAYFKNNMHRRNAYFDLFFRSVPDGGGFAVAAGLEQLIEYIESLRFGKDEIEYLKNTGLFDADFLRFLENFHFTGDIYAVAEGTPVFPNEPIITVKAPVAEAQLIETFALLTINHQSLIATKANRVVRAAKGKDVFELGSRRAQGASAAVNGARAAYIGGVCGSSCTLSGMLYGVPPTGTMAHSWVQMFPNEYEAFESYCKLYPNNTVLLVDTYNALKSGVPNAIKAFKNVLCPMGINSFAIRLDSGDISYLSKTARKMLDQEGLEQCRIIASNSLDEHIISDLVAQGAEIDAFGVGERLITSKSSPVFGGVYKLVAVESENGEIIPKIKISENVGKITNPHLKKLYRFYDKESGKAVADQLCIYDEVIDEKKPVTIFDPNAVWKRKTITNYTAEQLLVPIFKNGVRVYDSPKLSDIKLNCKKQIDRLWDEVKRFENPHTYYVDLSEKLWRTKNELLEGAKH